MEGAAGGGGLGKAGRTQASTEGQATANQHDEGRRRNPRWSRRARLAWYAVFAVLLVAAVISGLLTG